MLLTAGAPAPGIKSIKGIKRIEASPLDQKTRPEMSRLTHLMLLMLLMGVPPPMLWMLRMRMLLTAGAPAPGIKSIKNVKGIKAALLDQKTGPKWPI